MIDPNDPSGRDMFGPDVAAWKNLLDAMTVDVINAKLSKAGIGMGALVGHIVPQAWPPERHPHRWFVEDYLRQREWLRDDQKSRYDQEMLTINKRMMQIALLSMLVAAMSLGVAYIGLIK